MREDIPPDRPGAGEGEEDRQEFKAVLVTPVSLKIRGCFLGCRRALDLVVPETPSERHRKVRRDALNLTRSRPTTTLAVLARTET